MSSNKAPPPRRSLAVVLAVAAFGLLAAALLQSLETGRGPAAEPTDPTASVADDRLRVQFGGDGPVWTGVVVGAQVLAMGALLWSQRRWTFVATGLVSLGAFAFVVRAVAFETQSGAFGWSALASLFAAFNVLALGLSVWGVRATPQPRPRLLHP